MCYNVRGRAAVACVGREEAGDGSVAGISGECQGLNPEACISVALGQDRGSHATSCNGAVDV